MSDLGQSAMDMLQKNYILERAVYNNYNSQFSYIEGLTQAIVEENVLLVPVVLYEDGSYELRKRVNNEGYVYYEAFTGQTAVYRDPEPATVYYFQTLGDIYEEMNFDDEVMYLELITSNAYSIIFKPELDTLFHAIHQSFENEA